MSITTQDELNQAVKDKYSQLSKRLQQVAYYLLEHPNEMAIGTASNIALSAGVPASTLIRFARNFGFSGFSDIQKLFKSRLLKETPSYSARIQSIVDDDVFQKENAYLQLLNQMTQANTQSLENLAVHISEMDLEQTIAILSCAEIIHIQGARRSFPAACYLTYLLNNIAVRANLFNNLGSMQNVQLLTNKDALIAISFHPYAGETQELIEQAKQINTPTVLITDNALNPLSKLADVCLIVKEAEIHSFRSLSATMCVVQAIAISLGHKQDLTNKVN